MLCAVMAMYSTGIMPSAAIPTHDSHVVTVGWLQVYEVLVRLTRRFVWLVPCVVTGGGSRHHEKVRPASQSEVCLPRSLCTP
jgi:hypothetical protein